MAERAPGEVAAMAERAPGEAAAMVAVAPAGGPLVQGGGGDG